MQDFYQILGVSKSATQEEIQNETTKTRRAPFLVSLLATASILVSSCSSPPPHSASEEKQFMKKVSYVFEHFCESGGEAASNFVKYMGYHSWATQQETQWAQSLSTSALIARRAGCNSEAGHAAMATAETAASFLDHALGGKL